MIKLNQPVPNPNSIAEISKLKELNNYDQFFIQLLYGLLLGDGSIPKSAVNPNTEKARFYYNQSKQKREGYINFIFNEFKKNGFIPSKQQTEPNSQIVRQGGGFKSGITKLYFYTEYNQILYLFSLKFYLGRKIIPKTIRQDLLEIALAYWFSDDGSRRNPKGTGFDISTQSYSIYEVFVLCDVLRRKFNIMAWPVQEKAFDVTRLQQQGFDIFDINQTFDSRFRYYKILLSEVALVLDK